MWSLIVSAILAAAPLTVAAQTAWRRVAPAEARQTGIFRDPDITESSGAVMSRRIPGVFFTMNDSGNSPTLFATDTSGRALGRWRIPGTRNVDWESLTLGPCPAGSCIYVGDTGDNNEQRLSFTIYRVREPDRLTRFLGTADPAPIDLDTLTVKYPDHPHDTEAMLATPAGDLLLITKGRSDGVTTFRLPASSWSKREPVIAERIEQLPIEPDQRVGRLVTDAALAPDGRTVAVRTYTEIYFFTLEDGKRLVPAEPRSACSIAGFEPQGEGITWLDSTRLVLTSEKAHLPAGPIHIVRCPR